MRTDRIKLPQMNAEVVSKEIGDFIVEQVIRRNCNGCVIGLSGGVDSSTTAALVKKAFDEYNNTNPKEKLELVGYMLPSKVNSPDDAKDGIRIAEMLGIRYEVKSIEGIVNAFKETNPEALSVNYHKGNLMSRIRANILHTKSA